MPGFDTGSVMYALNVDFTGNSLTSGTAQVVSNGQLLIGSTALPNIRVGNITSPSGTLTIGYSSPNITIDVASGGAILETLTPDSGGAVFPTANNINVLGYPAGSSQVMKTFNNGGIFEIADQTFLSRYVVDTNTTAGQAGTYSTLQSAITQAIADGATGVGKCIYIRNATINETITVSTASVNITICGTGGKGFSNQGSGNPLFSGSFTNSGSGTITFSNVDISGTVTNSSTGTININACTVSGTIVCSGTSGALNLNNCYANAVTGTLSHGTVQTGLCQFSGGTFTFSNDAALSAYYSTFSGTFSGITSGSLSFNNCYVNLAANNLTGGTLIDFNSLWSSFNYYGNSSVTYQMSNSTAGNTYMATRTAISYVVVANQDYYIGVTDTSSARTITLPSASVIKNQSFIIKDESGAAATHNISVTVAGGVKTIDGVTTFAINTNYGSIQVIYDGTNYFIF